MKTSLEKIWKNKSKIIEGIKNSIIRNEFVEQTANLRMINCDSCELKGDDCAIKGTGPCCNQCGCTLHLKVRSLSSECPHPDGPKWKALLSEEEEDIINNIKD